MELTQKEPSKLLGMYCKFSKHFLLLLLLLLRYKLCFQFIGRINEWIKQKESSAGEGTSD